MTLQDLLPMIVISLVKGAIFGGLFAALFPRLHGWVLRRMGHSPEAMQRMTLTGRAGLGLAVLAGSGFAMVDLMGLVSEAAGLPELLQWAVTGLFAASAAGTVLIVSTIPVDQKAAD